MLKEKIKKCKRCKIELPEFLFDSNYCNICSKIIKVSKMSKKELVEEVIKLRDEVEDCIDEKAGIDI